MAYLDLHRKAFDDGTLCKLEIFEAYIQAWLPTFIMQNAGTICIFDLFAGPGYDKDGIEGSPIRIIKQVEAQTGNIFQKDTLARERSLWSDELGRHSLKTRSCSKY